MEQWYNCPRCNQDLMYGTNPCPRCKCSLAWSQQGPVLYLPPIGEPQQQTGQSPVEASQQQTPTQTIPQVSTPTKTNGCVIAVIVIVGIVLGLYGISQITQIFSPKKAEPTPSSSSQAASASSESEYRSKIVENSKMIVMGLESVSEMLKTPKIGDKDWTTLLAARLGVLKYYAVEGRKIEAPVSMAAMQNEYSQALDHCINCVDLIARALDTNNVDYMNQATDEMSQMEEHMSTATSMIEEFNSR
jgi:hypothetical protein